MLVCGAFLLAALAIGAAWNGRPFQSPDPVTNLSPLEAARRFAWYAALVLTGGVISGIAVIGAGGRLAMRLLAVTAGAAAQGRLTEADQVVGKITTDGTISFVLFNGIFGGVAAAAIYLVVRRFLPPGRLGGLAFGFALLVVLGTTIEPLRRNNPDFNLVGPGWLAVVVFGVLALAFGLVLSAVLARLSQWLPLPAFDRRVLVRYAAPAALAAVAVLVTAMLIFVGLAVVLVTRWRAVGTAVRSSRCVVVGRIFLLGVVGVALPNAVLNVVDIAGR